MRAIGGLHSGQVGVLISPGGIGASSGLDTHVVCTFDVLPGSSLPRELVGKSTWPCPEHATLAAHVFAALYELDHLIGQTYQNEKLWE